MGDDESELSFRQQLEAARPTDSIGRRAWDAISAWEREDAFVAIVIVPVAIAVGGILAVTLLLVATLFAPALAVWLLWLAYRSTGARRRATRLRSAP